MAVSAESMRCRAARSSDANAIPHMALVLLTNGSLTSPYTSLTPSALPHTSAPPPPVRISSIGALWRGGRPASEAEGRRVADRAAEPWHLCRMCVVTHIRCPLAVHVFTEPVLACSHAATSGDHAPDKRRLMVDPLIPRAWHKLLNFTRPVCHFFSRFCAGEVVRNGTNWWQDPGLVWLVNGKPQSSRNSHQLPVLCAQGGRTHNTW